MQRKDEPPSFFGRFTTPLHKRQPAEGSTCQFRILIGLVSLVISDVSDDCKALGATRVALKEKPSHLARPLAEGGGITLSFPTNISGGSPTGPGPWSGQDRKDLTPPPLVGGREHPPYSVAQTSVFS